MLNVLQFSQHLIVEARLNDEDIVTHSAWAANSQDGEDQTVFLSPDALFWEIIAKFSYLRYIIATRDPDRLKHIAKRKRIDA